MPTGTRRRSFRALPAAGSVEAGASPTFSVVIAANAATIADAEEFALAQTPQPLEVIVAPTVDDARTLAWGDQRRGHPERPGCAGRDASGSDCVRLDRRRLPQRAGRDRRVVHAAASAQTVLAVEAGGRAPRRVVRLAASARAASPRGSSTSSAGARRTRTGLGALRQFRHGSKTIRVGNLETRRDYTDVRHVAAAFDALLQLDTGAPTVFNVGSGRSVPVRELVAACEDVLDRRVPIQSAPKQRRAQDRVELVADPRLLWEATGGAPAHSLVETLADLLKGEGE